MKTKHLPWIGGLLGLSLMQASLAGQVTSTLKPNTQVSDTCVINSTNNLAFGSYIPSSSAPLETSGQISLTCTKGAVVTAMPLSGGSAMSSGGKSLSYGLYNSASLSNPWGSVQHGTTTLNIYQTPPPAAFYFYNQGPAATQAACASMAGSESYFWGSSGVNGLTGCFWGFTWSASAPYSVVTIKNSATSIYVGATKALQGNTSNVLQFVSGTQTGTGVYTVPYELSPAGNLQGASTSVKTPIVLSYYGEIPPNQDVPPGVYLDTVTVQVSF